jgi:hypothetical protein
MRNDCCVMCAGARRREQAGGPQGPRVVVGWTYIASLISKTGHVGLAIVGHSTRLDAHRRQRCLSTTAHWVGRKQRTAPPPTPPAGEGRHVPYQVPSSTRGPES